jgi:hypothetical protein
MPGSQYYSTYGRTNMNVGVIHIAKIQTYELHDGELHDLNNILSKNILRAIKIRMRWAAQVASTGEKVSE